MGMLSLREKADIGKRRFMGHWPDRKIMFREATPAKHGNITLQVHGRIGVHDLGKRLLLTVLPLRFHLETLGGG